METVSITDKEILEMESVGPERRLRDVCYCAAVSGSGSDIYCPRFWILDEQQFTLTAVAGDEPPRRLVHCNHCQCEYEIDPY
jgi:hypothetical protein